MQFLIEQIGIIHSPYRTKEECPIQGILSPGGKGRIEIFSNFQEGLMTIETFSHVYLFYIFDEAGEMKLSRPTFLDDTPHGVFASRHPSRPNSIGISIVRLLERRENILLVSDIDVLDGTPLIDIKPYIPRFDARDDASNGWVEELPIRKKPENRE